ncbi:hypothetical protein RI129_003640 [Pyrocoelia pectoralis]|uniref:Transcription termination factor 2 n=1 Tax=Pyrocoelia pectoralis TaxID=417401 RepID=A0AAN7VSG0_9COLE
MQSKNSDIFGSAAILKIFYFLFVQFETYSMFIKLQDDSDVQVIETTSPIMTENKEFFSSPDLQVIENTSTTKTEKKDSFSLQDVKVIENKSPNMTENKEFFSSPDLQVIEDTSTIRAEKKEVPSLQHKQQQSKVETLTLATHNEQKALTVDCLEQLHGSLKSCPIANTEVEQPKGLQVELMPHQKHALSWLMWREKQRPSGGILADDMGLGKTLTMISLTLKVLEEKDENADDENDIRSETTKYPGGTLVVCPASVIYQWEFEIKKHVKKGLLTVGLYHGSDRDTKAKRLAKHNIILTTFALVQGDSHKAGPLFKVKWERIIVDEAHQIRNHKTQTSIAICELSAKCRWALTGTPIHNKELDLYSLLKFLRCSPFDDLSVSLERWVADKKGGGEDRLHTVMSSLMLRRTKQELQEQKMLNCLPEKSWTLVPVTLEKDETYVYQKILIYSRTLFAQFLHQREQKDNAFAREFPSSSSKPNSAYFKVYSQLVQVNNGQAVQQHHILVLLLRLRQICCHPSLIIQMLDREENLEVGDDDEELNLIEQLNKLTVSEHEPGGAVPEETAVELVEASRTALKPSNPIFATERQSSKMKVILQLIGESIEDNDKIIVISQWRTVLDLLSIQLKINHLAYYQLDGTVPVSKRMDIVQKFNNPKDRVQILLLSLTAGGVGLNLIGANRLILTDLHWNPQLELQAQDRIYRVGQRKPVKVYKLMALDTIEERIKCLQDKKLHISNSVLTGVQIREQSKLSLNDLKLLFNM